MHLELMTALMTSLMTLPDDLPNQVLELKGLERHALRLLEHASVADPYSPNALSFHLNFLYTHALDDAAAARLAAFERAVPGAAVLVASRQMLANASAPMLHQRAQTLNGQVNAPECQLSATECH